MLVVNNFPFLITLLYDSMHKHHYQGFSMYSKVTKSIDVNSTVINKCHNKVKRLRHIMLYSKLVVSRKIFLITIGYAKHHWKLATHPNHILQPLLNVNQHRRLKRTRPSNLL
jgi:hypothetical protein